MAPLPPVVSVVQDRLYLHGEALSWVEQRLEAGPGLCQDQRHHDLPGGQGQGQGSREDPNHDGGAEAATAKNTTKMVQILLDKGASVLAVAKVIVALYFVNYG